MRNLAGIVWLFLLFSLLSLFSVSAAAQDFPKAELFGGYQFTRQNSTNLNGWDANFTGNYNRWFGLTGDFSGAYSSRAGADFKSYTFAFGPTVAARSDKFTPFAHFLLGGVHQVAEAGGSTLGTSTGFAVIAGGGVDAKIRPHLAVRLAQFDWMSFHVSGGSSNVFRYSGGIVVRF
jgi:hypothetical protein